MNRHRFLVLMLLCGSTLAFAQTTHHVAPPLINGAEHPEKVSDVLAWRMQLIASTSVASDSDVVKEHAALHRRVLGLDPLTDSLAAFRQRYEDLVLTYNNTVSASTGTTAYEQAALAQLDHDIDRLLSDMVTYFERNLAKEHLDGLNEQVQQSKGKIAFTEEFNPDGTPTVKQMVYNPDRDNARLVRTASITFNNSSQAGYTTYTALDTDGTYWYQTVYNSGASSIQAYCVYTPYEGWQPPPCPNITHQFITSNQINGQGSSNVSQGLFSPNQYVNLSMGNKTPVGSGNGTETSFVSVQVICTIAKTIFYLAATQFIYPAHEWVKPDTNNPCLFGVCGVLPTCTNSRPWALDIATVVGVPPMPPGLICLGACYRSGPLFSWACPPAKGFAGFCKSLSAPNWSTCTAHP